MGLRKKTYREYKPIETLPGEQAQVDWGHCGKIDCRRAQAFSLCLCIHLIVVSREVRRIRYLAEHGNFLWLYARALEYVGGVPREIVFDNAKTVVSERVGGVVRYNEHLLRLAASYGFSPRAAGLTIRI